MDNVELRIILSEEGAPAPPAQQTLTKTQADLVTSTTAPEEGKAAAGKAAEGQSAKSALTEAAGPEGAGALAGAAGEAGPLLAAAGPIGLAVAGAALAQKKINDAMEDIANNAKDAAAGLGELARNENTAALSRAADNAATQLGKIPIVGGYLETSIKATTGAFDLAKGVIDSFVDRGKQLADFSGPLAGASAMTEVRSLLADIKEARELGPELARLTDAQSRAETELREILLPIKVWIVEHLANLMERVAELLENGPANVYNFFVDGINAIIKNLEAIYNKLPGPDRHFDLLERIATNTKKPEDFGFAENQISDLMKSLGGPPMPWDNPADASRMASNQTSGIPALQGLVP